MISTDMKNPFLAQKLDDTASLPPGDVPELHAKVLEKCRTALTQVRQTSQSIGLLVVGEAGSGKSHLIAQLRRQLGGDPKVVLAAIPLGGAFNGRLWRHLRERFVTELFRPYPDRTDRLNGLLRILRNRFPKWAPARDTSDGLLGWLVGRSKSAESLQPVLDEFARNCELDYGLQKVLPKLASPQLTSRAQAWLRGKTLDHEDLTALGLPPAFPSEQEQEISARDVVLSFFRLAGEATVLFVCFDEVEAIQAGNHDAATLRQFTTLATDLLAQSGPRVVATFIRPTLQLAVSKAVERSNLDKIGQDTTVLPTLSWEQAVRVTTARLEAEPGCRGARRAYSESTFWPLGPEFVQQLFDQNRRSLTPRHLIRACAVEFERLQRGISLNGAGEAGEEDTRPARDGAQGKTSPRGETADTAVVSLPKPLSTAAPSEEFVRMWERQRRKLLGRPQGIPFDSVMAIGLPWLVELTETPLIWVQDKDPRLGDVNLVFQSKARRQQPKGISFGNHEPRLLWHRLDRIRKQWTAAKGTVLGSLVLLRSEAERTTEASESRLTALAQMGTRAIRVDRQPLAELAAFQMMLTAAQEGELTRSGKPVETAEYDAWAKEYLSEAVKDLFDCIFEL